MGFDLMGFVGGTAKEMADVAGGVARAVSGVTDGIAICFRRFESGCATVAGLL